MKGVPAHQQGHTSFAVNNFETGGTLKGLPQFLYHFKMAVLEVIKAHSAVHLLFYHRF
jgi:hypothetical protein